ncbi:MAG: hypothetical protein COA97_12690 [Flavobacteriales bacterium]|nr:MAG: hypothetical protein COA97_12690 [Flavobacteriales bacterium]
MKKIRLIVLIIIGLPLLSNSQIINPYILSGTIVDGETNKPLAGVHLLSSRKTGSKTNEIGGFSINIFPSDTLKISFIGFKTIEYIIPYKKSGKYLIKFRMYKDSISLAEVEVFPWPTYKEFKKAFLIMNKQEEKIKIEGLNMYIDKSRTAPKPTIMNPASYIYDKLFDKKAKMRRRLARRRKTIKNSKNQAD